MPVASRMLACIIAVLLATFAAGASGNAQSIAETARTWGLLGTWAIDCLLPASVNNTFLSYRLTPDGRVQHARNFGGGPEEVYEVQSARVTVDGLIELVVDFKTLGGPRRWTMAKGPDGRIRAISNSKPDGTDVSIHDGRFLGSGLEAPWQTLCTNEMVRGLLWPWV